jgi:hypothetical protein
VKTVKDDEASDLIMNIKGVSSLFDVYMDEEITELELKDSAYMDSLDSRSNSGIESRNTDETIMPIENEDKSISNIFSSLISERDEEDSFEEL